LSSSSITVVDNPSPDLWKIVLDTHAQGNLEQTIEYGEMKKMAYPRTETLRLLALESEHPVGVVQGYYKKRRGYGRFLTVGGVYGNGPLTTLKGKEEASVARELLEALERKAIKRRIVEAYVTWPESWGFLDIFSELGFKVIDEFNVYTVDLAGSSSDLWTRIASNKRKNIKRAQSQGVTVRNGTSEKDFQSFLEMLKASASRARFDPTLSEVEALWNILSPKGSARIFLAEIQSRDVAGVFALTQGDTVYARAAGSYEWAWNARPNDLLHWEVMNWGLEKGFLKYHMGLAPEPLPSEGSSFWGVWRWKREWNGRLEKMRRLCRIYLPHLERFTKIANRLVSPFKKLTS